MKICTNCNNQMEDSALFCTKCGARIMPKVKEETQYENSTKQNSENSNYNTYDTNDNFNDYAKNNNKYYTNDYSSSYNDFYDHTGEFDPKDIADNKIFAMLVYLTGTIGIIIALLAGKGSEYVKFHVKQEVKFIILTLLTSVVSLLLCWTVIVPIAALIFILVLEIIQIICFFSACKGRAKEAAIVRDIGFLN